MTAGLDNIFDPEWGILYYYFFLLSRIIGMLFFKYETTNCASTFEFATAIATIWIYASKNKHKNTNKIAVFFTVSFTSDSFKINATTETKTLQTFYGLFMWIIFLTARNDYIGQSGKTPSHIFAVHSGNVTVFLRKCAQSCYSNHKNNNSSNNKNKNNHFGIILDFRRSKPLKDEKNDPKLSAKNETDK